MLCMTEKLLNSSVKKPLGALPNSLLFGNAINHESVDIKDMDQQNTEVHWGIRRQVYAQAEQAPISGSKVTTSDK